MRTRVTTRQATLPASAVDQREYAFSIAPYPRVRDIVVDNLIAYTYDAVTESITDTNPKMQCAGSCLHTKVSTWLSDTSMQWRAWSPSGDVKSDYISRPGYISRKYVVPAMAQLTSYTATVQPFLWNEWSYDAVEKMRAQIGPGLLLPNFVAELVETGRDAKHKWQFRKKYLNVPPPPTPRDKPPFSKVLKKALSLTPSVLRKYAKRSAKINLIWQFVVRPTLADAKALAQLLESMQSRMSELIRGANKVQRGHYARRLDVVTLPAVAQLGSTTYTYNGAQFMFLKPAWINRPTYRATMLYSYDASKLQTLAGQLQVLLHAFGVSKVASIYWEALPFSFVVDWFVNVGDVLSSMEDRLIDPFPMVIHDFCHSVKYVWRANVEFNFWEGNPPGGTQVLPAIAHREFHHYERRRDTPCLYDTLSVRTPNLNQTGLGLSLIVVLMDGVKRKGKKAQV